MPSFATAFFSHFARGARQALDPKAFRFVEEAINVGTGTGKRMVQNGMPYQAGVATAESFYTTVGEYAMSKAFAETKVDKATAIMSLKTVGLSGPGIEELLKPTALSSSEDRTRFKTLVEGGDTGGDAGTAANAVAIVSVVVGFIAWFAMAGKK
jgi:hypothetical protein